MVLTGLAESVEQCGSDQTALSRFRPVTFAQCGQTLRLRSYKKLHYKLDNGSNIYENMLPCPSPYSHTKGLSTLHKLNRFK